MEETRVLTIVFTDIKGFTERTSQSNREDVSKLLQKHEELLLPLVKNYDGCLIKTIGDAFLLSFASPTNAVLCAVMMQEKLKSFNATVNDDQKIEIRIAMNTGEVIMRDGDVYGEPVNIAARIESLTDANEIWFSESTYLAMNRQEVPTSLKGEYRLKGIPEAVRVYRVVRDDSSELYARTVKSQLEKCSRMVADNAILVASARKTRISYFLGICILLATAFFAFRESDFDQQIRLAQEAASRNDYRAAIESFKRAGTFQPVPADKVALITESIENYVQQRLKNSTTRNQSLIDELDTFIGETRSSISIIGSTFLKCELDLGLAQAELWAKARLREQADLMLDNIAKRADKNPHVKFSIASFYSRNGYNWTRTIRYLTETIKLDPQSYKNHPVMLSEIDWFLNKVSPFDGYDDFGNYIASYCYETVEQLLRDSLFKPGKDNHTMRWNAKKILQSRKEAVDEVKFFLVDLFTSPGSLNSSELRETIDFFHQVASKPEMLAAVKEQAKEFAESFPLLDNYHIDNDSQVMLIVSGPLFEALEPYLNDRLTADRIHQRLNAYNVLSDKDSLDASRKFVYHLKNMSDFQEMQWSKAYAPALVDSMEYLKNNLPASASTNGEHLISHGRRAAQAASLLVSQIEKSPERFKDTIYARDGRHKPQDLRTLADTLNSLFADK